jgi:hypothetical protein
MFAWCAITFAVTLTQMTDQNPPQKSFRPWWRDYRKAAACLIGAGGTVLYSLVLRAQGDSGPAALILALGAIAAFLVARSSWRRGFARHRGHRVETSARSRLKRILPLGWSVDKTTPFVSGVGDVDMLIRTSRHGFVVEIKSWHVWTTASALAAAAQARNLLQALAGRDGRKWQAVIWLPKGKKKRTRLDRDVIVVAGSPVSLFWVLHLMILRFL